MSEDENIRAFPLSWPIGRPRTKYRENAPFHAKSTETVTRADGSRYSVTRKRPRSISESARAGCRAEQVRSDRRRHLDQRQADPVRLAGAGDSEG